MRHLEITVEEYEEVECDDCPDDTKKIVMGGITVDLKGRSKEIVDMAIDYILGGQSIVGIDFDSITELIDMVDGGSGNANAQKTNLADFGSDDDDINVDVENVSKGIDEDG